MFKVKRISIDAGSNTLALLTKQDAKELGLYSKDKIQVICSHSKKKIICDLEIFDSSIHGSGIIKKSEIGLLEHAYTQLTCSNKKITVKVQPAPKPKSIEIVRKKFEQNRPIKAEEFELIIQEMLENKFTDTLKTFFVLACAAHSMSDREVIGLTNAMVNAGQILDFKNSKNDIIVDKHCIGGVPNNRTTMVVIPIIAAAGLKIPKTSSRSITSPAGTADTMETLADVEIPLSKMHDIVEKTNGCLVWGGGAALSPADDVIIEIEHPLEIDSQGQMIASILSKKKCAGSTLVVIDIPVGPQAKITTNQYAKELKKRFEKIGRAIGIKVEAVITKGVEPIGYGIGPQLEAEDVIAILENRDIAPNDLKEKSLIMASKILELAQTTSPKNSYNYAKQILESGQALEKFNQIRELQGKKEFSKKSEYKTQIKAKQSGTIHSFDIKLLSRIAFVLGAPNDKQAGIKMYKKIGDSIEKSETLFELYATSKLKLEYGKTYVDEHPNFIVVK